MSWINGYVANQIDDFGLDEIQRLAVSCVLKQNVALDGPPGVGKTESVAAMDQIMGGGRIRTYSCDRDTRVYDLVSYPNLSNQGGVPVTTYELGFEVKCAVDGVAAYLDEFNLVKPSVQKKLNALHDHRRTITLPDNRVVTGKPGFLCIISYNPSPDPSVRDLEDSVADRFVHYAYGDTPPRLKSAVALARARKNLGLDPATNGDNEIATFPVRAIRWNGGSPLAFFEVDGAAKTLANILTGKKEPLPSPLPDNLHFYRWYPQGTRRTAPPNAEAVDDKTFSTRLSLLVNTIRGMISEGVSALEPQIKTLLANFEFDRMEAHEPSLRIQVAAIEQYLYLRSLGAPAWLAQGAAVQRVVDQVCYGNFRRNQVGDATNQEVLGALTTALGLAPPRTIAKLETGAARKA